MPPIPSKTLICAPAVVLRPGPRSASGDAGSWLGGLPTLPSDLDWPSGPRDAKLHFFAQINLAAVPRHLETAAGPLPLPDFPAKGTLFVFLGLYADRLHDVAPVLLFSPDAPDGPGRAPPPGLPDLRHDQGYIDAAGLEPSGQVLRQRPLTAIPFLSARRSTDATLDPPTEALAPLLQQHGLGAVLNPPQELSGAVDGLAAFVADLEIPDYLRNEVPAGVDRDGLLATWPFVFAWSKAFLIRLADEVLRVTRGRIAARDPDKVLPQAVTAFETLQADLKALQPDDPSSQVPDMRLRFGGVWSWFISRNWALDGTDVEAANWLAEACGESGPMPVAKARAFTAFLRRIRADALQTREPPALRMLHGFRRHGVKRGKVRAAASRAFANALQSVPEPFLEAPDLSDMSWDKRIVHGTRVARDRVLSGGVLQMFGQGDAIQTAVQDNRDKVLLLQLSDGFGTPLSIGDQVLQIWITPEDLAAGRFDRITHTLEAS